MGNGHSDSSSKPPDRKSSKKTGNKQPAGVICNTPFLQTLFKKMAVVEDGSNNDEISQETFENAFSGPLKVLGKLVYKHIKAASTTNPCSSVKINEFLRVAEEVMRLISNTSQLHYYFEVFSGGKDHLTIEDAYHMVQVCLSVSLLIAYLPHNPNSSYDNILRALAASMLADKDKISRAEFERWADRDVPNLMNGVHSFLLIKLSGSSFDDMDWHRRMSQDNSDQGTLSESSLSMIAHLDGGMNSLNYCSLWLLSCTMPALYVNSSLNSKSVVPNFLKSRLQQLVERNAWSLLYNSDRDGCSENRFEHHVFDYKGPTLMLITFGENLYAVASEHEWRESSQIWGADQTILVQILPRYRLIDHGRMIFVNFHTRGVFKGIQLGSNPKQPALRIKDFGVVEHYGVDLDLEQIEVWGCASAQTRQVQLKHRAWEKKEVEKLVNRKLKLEAWEDNPDRMLLDWAGVGGPSGSEKTNK